MNRGNTTRVVLASPAPRGTRCSRGLVHALLAALLATACARNEPPTGGPEDRFPPYIIETLPDTFSTIEPGTREVWFGFSERISERPVSGRLNDAVVVSPSTGEIRVKHRREGIAVEMREGFAPGLVYRVTLLPVIKDMFGNALPDPFDLVFSTGGEIVPNVIAGMVEDRVTGEATRDVRVAARFAHGDDTITHWNFSDSAGVFSLRYVPGGPFEMWAWQDQNRDGEIGDSEPQTSFTPGELVDAPDTTLAILTLIQPDTTPPRLTRATVDDSVTLKIEIDDYIEPDLAEGSITGVVTVVALDTASAEEDSLAAAGDTADMAGAEEAEVGAEDTATVAAEPGDTLRAQEAHEPGDTRAGGARAGGGSRSTRAGPAAGGRRHDPHPDLPGTRVQGVACPAEGLDRPGTGGLDRPGTGGEGPGRLGRGSAGGRDGRGGCPARQTRGRAGGAGGRGRNGVRGRSRQH